MLSGVRSPRHALQDAGAILLRPAAALSPHFRQAGLLETTEHRPWPLPECSWFMRQTWCDLLFAHWRVPRDRLEEVVPAQLPIDEFDGSAWIAVTPFLVSGLRLRGSTPVPRASRFPELNVRTYVTVDGKPGIHFFSLDAARRTAVLAARRFYRLPYYLARMRRELSNGGIEFMSYRVSGDGPDARFAGRYGPTGKPGVAAPGSIEHFLTERILRGEIHHPPWPLQPATGELQQNTMTTPLGIQLTAEPILHFAARQDVLLWQIKPA
jgi:uncharacterized protein